MDAFCFIEQKLGTTGKLPADAHAARCLQRTLAYLKGFTCDVDQALVYGGRNVKAAKSTRYNYIYMLVMLI